MFSTSTLFLAEGDPGRLGHVHFKCFPPSVVNICELGRRVEGQQKSVCLYSKIPCPGPQVGIGTIPRLAYTVLSFDAEVSDAGCLN